MSNYRNLSAQKEDANGAFKSSSSLNRQQQISSQNFSNPYLLAKPRSYAAALERPGSGSNSHRTLSKDNKLGVAVKANHQLIHKKDVAVDSEEQPQTMKMQAVSSSSNLNAPQKSMTFNDIPAVTPKATAIDFDDEMANHLRDTMPRQEAPPEPHKMDIDLKEQASKAFSPFRPSDSSFSIDHANINKSFQSMQQQYANENRLTSQKKSNENQKTNLQQQQQNLIEQPLQNYSTNKSGPGSQHNVVGVYETPIQGRHGTHDMRTVNMPTVSSAMRSLEARNHAVDNGRLSSRTQQHVPERSNSRRRLNAPSVRASNNQKRTTSSPRSKHVDTSIKVRRPDSAHGKQQPARVTSNTVSRTHQHVSSYSTLQSNQEQKTKNFRLGGQAAASKKDLSINVKSRTNNSHRSSPLGRYESRQESESIEMTTRFIKVSARIRPLLADEKNKPKILQVLQKNADGSYQMPQASTPHNQRVVCLRTKQHFNNGHRFYNFENTLDEPSTQADVFEAAKITEMCQQFIRQGRNSNVLVYGPTNSGKTHTMIGNSNVYQSYMSADKLNTSFQSAGGARNRRSRSPLKKNNTKQSQNGISIYKAGSKSRLDTSDGGPQHPLGESPKDGILPRALRTIIDEYQNFQVGFIQNNFDLRFSAVEIYNDQLTDLLVDADEAQSSEYMGRPRSMHNIRSGVNLTTAHEESIQSRQANLEIRELIQNGQKQLIVTNLTEQVFSQTEQAQNLLKQALYRRQVHETTKNMQSSRSHAIFMVKLYSRDDNSGQTSQGTFKSNFFGYMGGSKYSQQNIELQNQIASQSNLVSQFIFVDLAGSEKLDGETDPQRIMEAKHINKSLSALGNVIQALKTRPVNFSYNSHNDTLLSATASSHANNRRTGSNSPMKYNYQSGNGGQHIPYRDSKLTHILKPCFNHGNSMTHLIICLAPTQANLQECISSIKFAQNAKSIKQNQEEQMMQQKAVKIVGDGFGNTQQHRGFAPEKLWQLLQMNNSMGNVSDSLQTPASQNRSLTKQAEEEVFQGINEIERLLSGGNEDQLDPNNARLQKALILALAQLRQFKLSEKELNDKVQHLEAMLADKSARVGSGSLHRPNDSSATSFLENTSKFGTGTIQMNVDTPELDGRVEPANQSKQIRSKKKLLEGSLSHPLQSSSNSGTAFLDLMLINSSKLEPTDSQNTSLMLPPESRQGGINQEGKDKLQWSVQAQLMQNAGQPVPGQQRTSKPNEQETLIQSMPAHPINELRPMDDKDFTMKYLLKNAQSPDRPEGANARPMHSSTVKQARQLDTSGFVVTEEETVMLARDSAVPKNNMTAQRSNVRPDDARDIDFSSPTQKSAKHDRQDDQAYRSVKEYMQGGNAKLRPPPVIVENSSSVHTLSQFGLESSLHVNSAAPGQQLRPLNVPAETMSDKSIDSQEELIVNPNIDKSRPMLQGPPPLQLQGLNMNEVDSENVTIETQRHLLPPGSETGGQGNNQGGSRANFRYGGGLMAQSQHPDGPAEPGIRSATGSTGYMPVSSQRDAQNKAPQRGLSQMRSVFSTMRQSSQPKQQYHQYATHQTQSGGLPPSLGHHAQRSSLGGASQTVQTPNGASVSNFNRLPSRMGAQSPLTYMEQSIEPRSPQTEMLTSNASAFQTVSKAPTSSKKTPATYRATSSLGVKNGTSVTSARRPVLTDKRGKTPITSGAPRPQPAANGSKKRLTAGSKASDSLGRANVSSRQGVTGRVQVAAPATQGSQRSRANQRSPAGVKSVKSKK